MGFFRRETRPLPEMGSVDEIVEELDIELRKAQVLVNELRKRAKAVEANRER